MFNPAKFQFARREVEFAGCLITEEGIKPAVKYTEAIMDYPTPTSITEVRVWYGLINQVTFCFCKTGVMAPFRHLLSPATKFVWTDNLEEAFVASKKKIIEMIQIGVFAFDMELETSSALTTRRKEWVGSCSRRHVYVP